MTVGWRSPLGSARAGDRNEDDSHADRIARQLAKGEGDLEDESEGSDE